MMFLLCILFLTGKAATDDSGNYYVIQMPDEDPHRTPSKQFRVFWNVPTMQCKSKGIPFEHLFEKYGILQNDKDSFRGEKISILYDPGLFPALLKNESTGEYKFRNGGVPQEGDVDKHVASFKSTLEQSIPDPHFNGVGIIDFESWRPIFRQNFGVLVPYKDVSYQIERKKHWIWPEPWIKAEAKRRFEEKARAFMQTTLSIAKQMRPKAQWGYYGFPYCFNMASSNMRERCADRVPAENDDVYWLWLESTALYPSVYSSNTLTTNQLAQMVRGRVREAARVRKSGTPIFPYFWFRYHNTNGGYLSEADLQIAIKTMHESDASGFILWGSSYDVNTVEKCKNLFQYVVKYLGPEVAKYTKYDRMQSTNDEVSTVVANKNDHENFNSTVSTLPTTDRTLSATVISPTTNSLSSHLPVITTDTSFSNTSSTLFTTIGEWKSQKTLKPGNQKDLEYYDDSEEQNITTIKDVNFQIDSEYFWLRPENYTDNIKKQVDYEMTRKSDINNIEISEKNTTESVIYYPSELDASLVKEAPNLTSQEDDLDKVLIQSTTEDEFMDGLTTITEKGSSYDIENYESIDIMYDEVETNTKRNIKRLQYEKQDNIDSQNERFGREFEAYEVGSQVEDQLNEDYGSDGKMEKVSKTATEDVREVVTPNILNNQGRSHGRTERILNTVTEDGFMAVLPKIIGNNSSSIPKNDMEVGDATNESTTIGITPGILDGYPNSKQVIPLIKDERLGDGPPVLPLHHEINRNTIKLISESYISDMNASRNKNKQTHSMAEENRNSVKQIIEIINTQANVSENNNFLSVSAGNDILITANESAFTSEKHLINTTQTNNLLGFLKKLINIDYSDGNVKPNIKEASISLVNNNYNDKIIINDNLNGTTFEKLTKSTKNETELTTISTISTKIISKETDILIKKSETPRAFKSKNEKKGLPKTRTEVITSVSIDTTTESFDKGHSNVPVQSNQVSGSSAHRSSRIRHYYCIIFYFYSISKCLCDYFGQCS